MRLPLLELSVLLPALPLSCFPADAPFVCPFVCPFICPFVSESRRIRMRLFMSGSNWRFMLAGSMLLLFTLLFAPPTASLSLSSSSLDSSLLAHSGGVLGVTLRLRIFETAGDSRAAGLGRCADEDDESWYRFADGAVARLLPPFCGLPLAAGVRGTDGGATFLRMVTVRVLILGLLGSNMARAAFKPDSKLRVCGIRVVCDARK